MTWIVIGLLLIFGYFGGRKLSRVPSTFQSIVEIIFEFLKDITYSTLGQKDGKRFLPLILTLFIFVLVANWLGTIPNIIKFIGSVIGFVHGIFGTESAKIVMDGFTRTRWRWWRSVHVVKVNDAEVDNSKTLT